MNPFEELKAACTRAEEKLKLEKDALIREFHALVLRIEGKAENDVEGAKAHVAELANIAAQDVADAGHNVGDVAEDAAAKI